MMRARNVQLKFVIPAAILLVCAAWRLAMFVATWRETQVIADLEAAGADVFYVTHDIRGTTNISVNPPRSDSWLGAALNCVWPAQYGVSIGIDDPMDSEHWRQLAKLERLESLRVSADTINDEAVEVLGRLTQLEFLDLSVGGLTNDHLRRLRDLTRLKTLLIRGAEGVDDEALPMLDRMRDLHDLVLDGASLTDAGLEHLASLGKLQSLSLGVAGHGLTENGVEALKRSLPNCEMRISETE